jgi:RNA polymerase sigma-70 factor (ECF subfamily)
MMTRQKQFDALVRSHSSELFRFACWLTRDQAQAHDLLQETFMRAWRAMDDLRDPVAVKAWLFTIVRREHARTFERKRLDTEDLTDLQIEDTAPSADEQSQIDQLRHAIGQLDRKYREPLVLQVLGGFSCQEIADQLGITESAVMTQVFRARQKLKANLEGSRNTEGRVYELR